MWKIARDEITVQFFNSIQLNGNVCYLFAKLHQSNVTKLTFDRKTSEPNENPIYKHKRQNMFAIDLFFNTSN